MFGGPSCDIDPLTGKSFSLYTLKKYVSLAVKTFDISETFCRKITKNNKLQHVRNQIHEKSDAIVRLYAKEILTLFEIVRFPLKKTAFVLHPTELEGADKIQKMTNPEMKFLDININLTKDSSLFLHAFQSPFCWQFLKKTMLFSGLFMNSILQNGKMRVENQTKTRVEEDASLCSETSKKMPFKNTISDHGMNACDAHLA